MLSVIGLFFSGVLKMLVKVGTWLVNNPAIFMTAIISTMFLMVVISKNGEIKSLEQQSAAKDERIATTITALAQARANNATLNQSLITQGQSLQDLKDRGTASDAKFDKFLADQAAATATFNKKMVALDKAVPGADKCLSALALIRSNVQ